MSTPLERAARAVAHELAAASVHVTAVDVMRGPRLASLVVSVASSQCVTRALRVAPRLEAVLGGRVRVSSHGFKVIVETPLPKAMWTDLTVGMVRATFCGESRVVVVVGHDARGLKVQFDFADPSTPHLFVVGATGSGKTTALQSIVWQLAVMNPPGRLALVLVDGLASGLAPFSDVPHLALPLATTPDAGAAGIATVCAELDARIADPSRRTPLVVVVDELAQATADRDAALAGLARIAATGRGLGVHLIACTQHPTANVVSRLVSANITTRLVGKVADAAASRLAMGSDRDDARTLAGAGDMLLCRGEGVRRVQVPTITDAEWATLPSGPRALALAADNQKATGATTETIRHAGHAQRPTTPDEVGRVAGWWQDGRPPGIGRVKREVGCGDGHATRLIAEAKAWRERGGVLASCHPADALMRAHVGATTAGVRDV